MQQNNPRSASMRHQHLPSRSFFFREWINGKKHQEEEQNCSPRSIFFFSPSARKCFIIFSARPSKRTFFAFSCVVLSVFFLPIFLAPVNSPPLSVRNYCDTDVYCTEVGFTYWDRRLTSDHWPDMFLRIVGSNGKMAFAQMKQNNETYNAVGIAQTFLKSMKASVQF